MPAPAQDIETKVIEFILAANVQYIDQLNLNLFARDMPERLDTDPSPSCIVVVGDEMTIQAAGNSDAPRSNTSNYYDYPVLVLLVKKTSLAPRADPWRKESRWKIREVLNRPMLLGREGVVKTCRYNPRPDFQPTTFGTGFKVSTQLFTYRTEEIRSA